MMKRMAGILFIILLFQGAIFASPFSIIYHGSNLLFDQVEPRYTARISKDEVIVWEGAAIFGTDDYRVALFYTHHTPKGYGAGIDLITLCNKNEPIAYGIMGGSSEDEAMEALWGTFDDSDENSGWIYILDGRKFLKEPGLGEMEVITRDLSANIGRISINRRKEIQHFIDEGLVKICWKP